MVEHIFNGVVKFFTTKKILTTIFILGSGAAYSIYKNYKSKSSSKLRIKEAEFRNRGGKRSRQLSRQSISSFQSCDGDKDASSTQVVTKSHTKHPPTPHEMATLGLQTLEKVCEYWENTLDMYMSVENECRNRTPSTEIACDTRDNEDCQAVLNSLLNQLYKVRRDAEQIFLADQLSSNKNNDVETFSMFSEDDFHTFKSLPPRNSSVEDIEDDSFRSQSSILSHYTMKSAFNEEDLYGAGNDEGSDRDTFASAFGDAIGEFCQVTDLIVDKVISTPFDPDRLLYRQALDLCESEEILYRTMRTHFVGCESDDEYLAKMHCIRLAFTSLMNDNTERMWWIDKGRELLSQILIQSGRADVSEFVKCYDRLILFLDSDKNITQMMSELEYRDVKCCNFYDIVLDYILLDSFQDLDCPPSSIVAVMNNRWLSNSFKQSALETAIWSMIKTKRQMVRQVDGFKSQFYDITSILTPTLAWGFFGPNEDLRLLMLSFKSEVIGFVRDIYSFRHVCYESVKSTETSISQLARTRFSSVEDMMKSKTQVS